MKTGQPQDLGAASRPARRIETQIHRRKKAQASSPMLPEWDQPDSTPPLHLRMEARRMDRSQTINVSTKNRQ